MDKETVQEVVSKVYGCYRRSSDEQPREEVMEEVRALYASLSDPDAEHYNKQPVLFFAAEHADPVGVEVLLNAGADATYQTEYNYTPLHRLAYKNAGDYVPWADEKKVVELLLNAGTSVIRKDVDETTSVYIAAQGGKFRFLQAVAEAGKKMDVASKNGNTPLHAVCEYAVNVAESFFKYTKPKYDEMMAQTSSGSEMENRMLENRKASQQEQYDRDLEKVNAYFETVKCLLEAGLDPEQKNDYGRIPKEMAFECQDIRISALLNGTYVEEGDSGENALRMKTKGMTLMQATELKDYDAVAALLELGADPNEQCGDDKRYGGLDMQGKVPLAMACLLLDLKLISLLLQNGADPNFKDVEGKSPAVYGITSPNAPRTIFKDRGIETLLKEMVEKGLQLNHAADEKGNTLLNIACGNTIGGGSDGQSVPGKFVQQLLRHKADPNIANYDGITPLMQVCKTDDSSVENLQISLLEAGADVAAKDANGNTPLMYVAQNRGKSLAKNLADMLFEFGNPKLDAINNDGKSALEFATEMDNENLVNYLLTKM